MKRLSYILLVALSFFAATASAQEFRSGYFMQSNRARHQINPALLDTAYMSVPILGNINIGATGNVGLKNFVYKLDGNPDYDYTTFMHPSVDAGSFLGDLHDKNRLDTYVGLNIFSKAFKAFGGVNLVELNMRSNIHLSMPKELFEFMKETGAKEHYELKDIGLRTENYMELAFGHSRQLNDQWRVGAKLKFLLGMGYADLTVDKLNVTMNGDAWDVDGDARLTTALLKSEFTHTDTSNDTEFDKGRPRVDGLDDVSFGMPGFGMAVDLGATYQFNPDLKFSASLTDFGFMSWSGANKASSAGHYKFDGFYFDENNDNNGFDDIYAGGKNTGNNKLGDQFEKLGDQLGDLFALYDDGKGTETRMLAATLNLGAEYTLPVYRPLRFGFLYSSRIQGIYSYHQGMLSAVVRPVKCFEATVNTAVTSTGCTFGAAASVILGKFNLYVGSDRFFGKVSKEFIPLNSFNANAVFGMSIDL